MVGLVVEKGGGPGAGLHQRMNALLRQTSGTVGGERPPALTRGRPAEDTDPGHQISLPTLPATGTDRAAARDPDGGCGEPPRVRPRRSRPPPPAPPRAP